VFVISDSDEHNEEGHITEDFDTRIRQQDKRMQKEEGLKQDMLPPETYGPEDAEELLVCWGSTYMPCREAVDMLNDAGESVAMVHFSQVWPLDADVVRSALRRGDGEPAVTCLEGNATGQFASVLREQGLLPECELMLRYDGRPFSSQEIAERFQS
jgi:2-oxoglutarate ferredoxin oxidoreductase subunit alpha